MATIYPSMRMNGYIYPGPSQRRGPSLMPGPTFAFSAARRSSGGPATLLTRGEPVGHLDGEEVVAVLTQRPEHVANASAERGENLRLAVLLPHQKQCAARTPFPAQDQVAAE